MVERMRNCRKCGLCENQTPLLDTERECEIFWVGLSAKKALSDHEVPLAPDTNTGRVIRKIEEECSAFSAYRTNLVKCLPLSEDGKLRYPRTGEIDCCFGNLIDEIDAMRPHIVFLLGERVCHSVERHLRVRFSMWNGFDYKYSTYGGVHFVPIQHPSYIYVYKRKKMEEYVSSVRRVIELLLQ